MTGQVTSPGFTRLVPSEWRNLGAFILQPDLPGRAERPGVSVLPKIASLAGLDLLLMSLLIGSLGLASTMGWQPPTHAMQGLALTPALIAFIVIGGPVAEEILFRGWLSGRPGHVGALLAIVGGGMAVFAATLALPLALGTLAAIVIAIAALVLAIVLIWRKRHAPAMGWFKRNFRVFYILSAIAFAGAHLVNFGGAGGALVLPLILPQFLLAFILGYLRVQNGLWSSMLLHALHNVIFLSLAMVSTG